MRKSRTSTTIRLAAALSCCLTAACSGGGGTSPATGTPGTSSTPATTPPPNPNTFSTGVSGTVAAPAAATFGTAQTQTATSGGPTFDGSSGSFPANVTFPLISSSLQKTQAGLAAAAGDQGATATVVSTSNQKSILQISVPSLNLNFTGTFNTNLVSGLDQVTDGYSYVVMGLWAQNANQPANSGALQSSTAFVFGYETPAAAMPSNGTGTFAGFAAASVYKPAGTDIQTSYVEGSASFSANFGSFRYPVGMTPRPKVGISPV